MKSKVSEYIRRYFVYILGIYVLAMGLALIIKSTLGTSPISSWAYVMSCNTNYSVGTYTFIINMFLIVGQCLLLHHRGLKKQLLNIALQIPFSFLFSAFIDFNIYLLRDFVPANYGISLLALAIGCIVQSIGILLEVRAGVTMMSGEAFVYYVCYRFSREFGKIKVCFDVSLVLLAIVCSLAFNPSLDGIFNAVREGTIVAALCVGQIVRLLSRHAEFINTWCKNGSFALEEENIQAK